MSRCAHIAAAAVTTTSKRRIGTEQSNKFEGADRCLMPSPLPASTVLHKLPGVSNAHQPFVCENELERVLRTALHAYEREQEASEVKLKRCPMSRPDFRRRGYSSEWTEFAARFLQASPWCWGCASIGVETRAVVLDHIVPLSDSPALLLDPHNCQPLCRHCHDTVKRSLEAEWRKKKIAVDGLRMGSKIAVAAVKRLHRPAVGVDGLNVKGT